MGVIINDFEVVAEPAPEPQAPRADEAPAAGAARPAPRPSEVRELLAWMRAQEVRLRAH